MDSGNTDLFLNNNSKLIEFQIIMLFDRNSDFIFSDSHVSENWEGDYSTLKNIWRY